MEREHGASDCGHLGGHFVRLALYAGPPGPESEAVRTNGFKPDLTI